MEYLIKNGKDYEVDPMFIEISFGKNYYTVAHRIFPDIGASRCNLPLFFQQERF